MLQSSKSSSAEEAEGETLTTFQDGGEEDIASDFNIPAEQEEEVPINDIGFSEESQVSNRDFNKSGELPSVQAHEVLNFGGISDEKDLLNMQAAIREIREERQEFLNRIQDLETTNKEIKQENLTLKAELDEKRIELSIVQKRQVGDREDLREKLRLSEREKNFIRREIEKT